MLHIEQMIYLELGKFSFRYTGYELRMTSLACYQNKDSVLSIMLHITTGIENQHHRPINIHLGMVYQSAQECSGSILAIMLLSRTQQTVPSVGLFYAGISQYIYPQQGSNRPHQPTHSTHHFHTRTSSPRQGTQKNIGQHTIP